MTAQNLDDMANDLLALKKIIVEEKEKIGLVETKLGLLDHLLNDSAKIKEAVEKDADKIERRLEKLEELLTQTQELKKKVPGLSPSVFVLASQGQKRKEIENKHHHSISFIMVSVSEDERPKFNIGRDEEECEEIKEWIGHFKSFPPTVDTKYLNMMFAHYTAESSSIHNPPPQDNTFDLWMLDASKALNPRFQFGIKSMNNLVSQMPDQPVLNIQCQPRDDIKTSIQMLGQWTVYKRTQNDTLTG